jgi:hypothetical protein
MDQNRLELAKRAVVRAGRGGRGFVVGADKRYVITAAHCLPQTLLPQPHLANGAAELTFPKFLGPLADEPSIYAELCAVDLCDDFAAFEAPDGQAFPDESRQYEEFAEQAAIPVARSPDMVPSWEWQDHPGAPAHILMLDGEWQPCKVHNNGRLLWVEAGRGFQSGMSGSPILNADGAAIGVVSTSGGQNLAPSLSDCLPPWL